MIAGIAPHDSQERFEGLGVTVLREHARFRDAGRVDAGGTRVRARRFVVATGSRPLVPPVPGLAALPYLTNETIFDLDALPARLLVLGGGPIGCELAQAFRRLGAATAIVEARRLLGREDPELAGVVRTRLQAEGVEVLEGGTVTAAAGAPDGGVALTFERDGAVAAIAGSHLLVASGRVPQIDGLDLDKAGIAHGPAGIAVDSGLRTSNPRVFAIGDVAGGPQFIHAAGHHAGIVIPRALFRLPARALGAEAVPRVTYTDPELAQVGLDEAAARARHGEIRVLRWPFAENDRARAVRDTDGLIKLGATPRGRLLGAGIAGAGAGDQIQPWVLALAKGIGLRDMAGLVLPYPTRGEAGKRAAGEFFRAQLFSTRTRGLLDLLARLG